MGAWTDYIDEVLELIYERHFDRAEEMLRQELAKMPPGWTPETVVNGKRVRAFWFSDEFIEYCRQKVTPGITWAGPSYACILSYLGSIAVSRRRWEEALSRFEESLRLEPDHPAPMCEMGYVLQRQGRHEEALALYRRAAQVRPWATNDQKARALRGAAVSLVDLHRLDEAEHALRASLKLAPGNRNALQELDYIEDLREAGRPGPPLDFPTPTTLALLKETLDLPPLVGPQVIGSNNYTLIYRAFRDNGWAGFEQEFDRIVSPDREDYLQLKGMLLREPIFRMAARMDGIHPEPKEKPN